ncbi:DoxX family protein [Paucihalobacter sp.]|uniref:DoxX family protein n=1 Tax=Paucihalobacter sp. TaxID=2850405 RepID=UPI002FDFAB10
MSLYTVCVLLSSVSFLGYGVSYFTGPHMKSEFKRFQLEKLGLLTVVLELLGAFGLMVGFFFYKPLLIISAGGLALLMLLGLIVRLRLKDSLWISLPALFFMVLNGYILWGALQ